MILSYHGCHTDDARLLLQGDSFHASENPYDWLGKGVYFWESDPVRAYQWAVRGVPILRVSLELWLILGTVSI